MKTSLLLLAGILLGVAAQAQTRLTGQVADEQGKPLSFANVLLVNAKDSALVKGAVASEAGAFLLENLRPGRYVVAASAVGFRKTYSPAFALNATDGTHQLAPLRAVADARQLNEVQVLAQKPLFEQQMDRLVINVQSSITSAGSTVLDILERSPGVTVDRQGGILSLIGKSGVRVLIDGKLSRLPAEALVQMLAGIGAGNTEKIELITTPSARFDAEGNAGFINIVLKKNRDDGPNAFGTNGSLDATLGYGYYEKPTGSLTLNHRTKRVNLFGDYSILYDHGWMQLDTYWQTAVQNQLTGLYTTSDRILKRTVHNARAGFDYTLSPKTTVGGLLMGFDNKLRVMATNDSRTTRAGQLIRQVYVADNEINQWQHLMGNLNLRHTVSTGQEISIDLDYLRYYNTNPHDYVNRYPLPEADRPPLDYLSVRKKTPIQSWVAKLDYTRTINPRTKLEAGGKSTFFRLQNDVAVARNQTGQWETDSLLSQNFAFVDDVHAAYAALHQTLSARTKIQAGLRYEYTATDIRSLSGKELVHRRYGNFFPSVFLLRDLSKTSSLQLSYSHRIERPAYNLLAPFVFFADPSTATGGNPLLLPTLISSLQTVYRFRDSYLLTLNYSRDRNAINRFTLRTNTRENRSVYVPENIRLMQTLSLSFGFPARITPWWQLQANLIGIRAQADAVLDNKAMRVQKWYGSVNVGNTIKLPRAFTAELTGNYQSPFLLGLQFRKAQGYVNVGLQKKLKGENGTLKATVSDVFWTNRMQTASGVEALNTVGGWSGIFEPRVVRLTYSRRFGNTGVKASSRRQTASDEERRRVN